MPFLQDLNRSWADCPPLRRMVAAYLGIKPKERTPGRRQDRGQDISELLAMFPTGKIGAGKTGAGKKV